MENVITRKKWALSVFSLFYYILSVFIFFAPLSSEINHSIIETYNCFTVYDVLESFGVVYHTFMLVLMISAVFVVEPILIFGSRKNYGTPWLIHFSSKRTLIILCAVNVPLGFFFFIHSIIVTVLSDLKITGATFLSLIPLAISIINSVVLLILSAFPENRRTFLLQGILDELRIKNGKQPMFADTEAKVTYPAAQLRMGAKKPVQPRFYSNVKPNVPLSSNITGPTPKKPAAAAPFAVEKPKEPEVPIESVCPECGTKYPTSRGSCPRCEVGKCRHCGEENTGANLSCVKCGKLWRV